VLLLLVMFVDVCVEFAELILRCKAASKQSGTFCKILNRDVGEIGTDQIISTARKSRKSQVTPPDCYRFGSIPISPGSVLEERSD
jgi:hypothetical protein